MILKRDVAKLQEAIDGHIRDSGAEMGVFIRHVGSGITMANNPDELYLLASVFKVPVLLEALAQVDEGRIRIDERVPLRWEDQLPTSMVLEHLQPGLMPTFRDLLAAMITVSDNTATDMVSAKVGLDNVRQRLNAWGLRDISIRMSVKDLFDAGFAWPDATESMVGAYRRIMATGPIVDPFTGDVEAGFGERMKRGPNWDSIAGQRSTDNNVGSPKAIAEMLERLVRGELLSRASTGVALDILLRQHLNQRLPRFLPRPARMAHKTGTFFSARNDAGILYLPGQPMPEGRVIIVAFAVLDRERLGADPLQSVPYIDGVDAAMGHIARAACDFFAPLPN